MRLRGSRILTKTAAAVAAAMIILQGAPRHRRISPKRFTLSVETVLLVQTQQQLLNNHAWCKFRLAVHAGCWSRQMSRVPLHAPLPAPDAQPAVWYSSLALQSACAMSALAATQVQCSARASPRGHPPHPRHSQATPCETVAPSGYRLGHERQRQQVQFKGPTHA